MMGWLNIGSLVLGLIAWILPLVNLSYVNKQDNKNWAALSVMSLSACVIALSFQIFYNYHLVKIGDWSALMDTTGAVAIAAAVLIAGTLFFNTINLIVYRGTTAK
ncbi:hypothetical protein [Salipaludibacillus aurantiacus]|uniref:Cytochrome c oxidase subunit 4 n=1 Tax=Salipaludibacillus aurantiacus TaxID=1601833 RepID=A0A1H9UTL1_9BACI|nr:hypothetical protein [Salipaludibacillus aurantiacus]SES12484.1 cytochrome c oxidase subunit 4 [Salipaludibacillus aurantiacus]